jgi:hypothetical protein
MSCNTKLNTYPDNIYAYISVLSVHLVIQTFPSISDFHKTNNFLVVID